MRLKCGRSSRLARRRTASQLRSGLASGLLGATLLLLACSGPALANGANGRGTVLLVFGCYVTLPEGFVVNTRETEYTSLFLRSDSQTVRIAISTYRGALGDDLQQIESRRTQGITIEEYRFSRDTKDDPRRRVLRLHDDEQEMMIYGATDELVQSVLASCASDRPPLQE